MKYNTTSKSLSALLLAASATSLCAIERPVPAEQPKEKPAAQVAPNAQPKAAEQPLAMPEAKVAQRPFLGVLGAPVSEAMATQMGLADGIGLTLQHVAENTPAEKSGLKKHDIITQLGGKDIGNLDQLRNAILEHKPNDKVEIRYISGGKAITKQVTLGSAAVRPQALRGQAPMPQFREALPKEMLENLPPEQRKQLEQLLQGNLNHLDFRKLDNLDVDQLQKHFKGFDNGQRLELNFDDLMKNGVNNKTRMKMVDPEGSVTLETEGDKKSIQLHDTEGKLLYKGPFNTKEDKLKIPEELRERANKLQVPEVRFHKGQQKNAKPQARRLNLDKDIEQLLGKELQGMKLPEELKQLMKQANQGLALPGKEFKLPEGGQMQKFEFNFNGNKGMMHSSSTMTDPATGNSYSQRKNEDGKELEIKDKAGKLLYSGPLNSSSDYEMVPEEFRPFLKNLDNFKLLEGGNLKLELAPRELPQEPQAPKKK